LWVSEVLESMFSATFATSETYETSEPYTMRRTHIELSSKGKEWHHFPRAKEVDFGFLQDNYKFHHLDYDDIRTDTPISKMDTYKDYVFFIFHIPTLNEQSGRIEGIELYVFLHAHGIVTITEEPVESVEKLINRVSKSPRLQTSLLGRGGAFVLHRLLFEVFRKSVPLASQFTKQVTSLEDEMYQGHQKKITIELGNVRRNTLFLRHIIDPQRHILSLLAELDRSFLPKELDVYFDDVKDILDTVWLTCDNLKLIIDGLFEVSEALLTHKTNDVVTLLTIISAILMAPALIAGFYGMNVSWLPFAHDASAVGFVYLVSLLIVLIAVVSVLSRRR